ncbi:MAG: helix-hairpin-helix domain-containing protein [Candidatus Omnitrophica bacterium]|nr:helix-hairpin-helix domain-containing protein [Candidatus Omnitrophota bacterium]MDD5592561.1 helix-hairpin-helix domain-containing protein [Candidatus Omnitrophota bacterium]
MIARICGKVTEKGTNFLFIDINGLTYKIFIPVAVMQRLEENISEDGRINLITYHYFQVEPAKSTPILIGFLNEVEKEFFEAFITVSGIGPRAALKALNKPISQVARAIDEADIVFLQSLPGIGQQRAKEIVAKLQNKVGKFGLIQDDKIGEQKIKTSDIEAEALAVLAQLEYKKSEAHSMIKKALERDSHIQTTEELLNEVYKQKRLK